jgi:hypothetical protein
MITRRTLLLTGASSIALAACSTSTTTTVNTQVPVWAAALKAVLTEIVSVLPQLQAVGLSGTALTQAQTIIGQIETALSAIGAASSASQGATTLATVESYINALAPLVLPFVGLVPGGSVIGLIIAALPEIELALNFVISLLTPQAKSIAATAPPLPASAPFNMFGMNSRGYLAMLEQRAASTRASRKHKKK